MKSQLGQFSCVVFVALGLLGCGASDQVGFGVLDGESGEADGLSGAEGAGAQRTAGAVAGVGGAGAECTGDAECEGRCVFGVCGLPAVDDGRLSPSAGETDVDCGGPHAAPCADGKRCAVDRDCGSDVCAADGTCAAAPSCRGRFGEAGVGTCGAGEVGAAGAQHESCCRSLPLPQRPERSLDRYEITAGRVRAFVDGVTQLYGRPDVRRFAVEYAAAHPDSQLGDVARDFPSYLGILPDRDGTNVAYPLPVHLGAFPLDPINSLDGCFVGDGAYGHPTYWQEPAVLRAYGEGTLVNGQASGERRYSRDQLDEKSMNCAMPLLLATFCAWDGGELARTNDYWEIWGRRPVQVGSVTVYIPWETLLPWGQFNWQNGRSTACSVAGWPGCENSQYGFFYRHPAAGFSAANDDSPSIAAPGRFPRDVTAIRSAGGEGWFDVGGNFLEAAWYANTRVTNSTDMVCDVSAGAGVGANACEREPNAGDVRRGTLRYRGPLPGVELIGYSFEGHTRYAEAMLSAEQFSEPVAGGRNLHFQYGKVGGRCARPSR